MFRYTNSTPERPLNMIPAVALLLASLIFGAVFGWFLGAAIVWLSKLVSI